MLEAENKKLKQRRTLNQRRQSGFGRAKRVWEGGHWSASVDLAICEMLELGVSCSKVPQLFRTFARLYDVKLPTRKIGVRGPDVGGKRSTVHRVLIYAPGVSHVKEMRAVMNQLNKLQAACLICSRLLHRLPLDSMFQVAATHVYRTTLADRRVAS